MPVSVAGHRSGSLPQVVSERLEHKRHRTHHSHVHLRDEEGGGGVRVNVKRAFKNGEIGVVAEAEEMEGKMKEGEWKEGKKEGKSNESG